MTSTSLSQVLLSPPVQVNQNGGAAEPAADSESFAKFLQKRADQQQERQNQLGTADKAASAKDQADEERDRAKKNKATANQNAAALLLAILNTLKQVASDAAGKDGVFVLHGVDRQQFVSLLQSMGLGADEAGSFGQYLSQIDSPLRLDDFLAMLANRLEKLTQATPVTIQETDLPFIQSLLDRFGIAADQIKGATEPAVTGDNKLDLKTLVAGLKNLENSGQQGGPNNGAVTLSEWDLEQLRNMLSEAGLADADQQAMLRSLLQKSGANAQDLKAYLQQKIDAGKLPVPFTAAELAAMQPDKLAAVLDKYGLAGAQSASLTLDQLTSFLDKVAATVQEQRPKIDVAAFADKLGQLFEGSQPAGSQPDWMPLLADSLQQIYNKLRQLVDFSKVSVVAKEKAALRQQYLAEHAGLNEATDAKALADLSDGNTASTAGGSGDVDTTADDKALMQAILGTTDKPADGDSAEKMLSLDLANAGNVQSRDLAAVQPLPQQTASPSPGFMEQQLFDQISKGALRGLQNGEHHLVLKLHPPELGEVKVDLTVHHDQVSVSFAMDNSKVKQAMENNMQQFRDNLAQRGFVLQNCFVSVGNGSEGNDAWRRFEQAMQAGNKVQSIRQADVPVEMLYQKSAGHAMTDGSISVFI